MNLPVVNLYGGNVYWVSSAPGGADSTGQAGTSDFPFATLDYAVGRCIANNGDVIMVAPNHSETVTGTEAINFDVDGITVIGLGRGDQRPNFLTDGANTVVVKIDAADVTLKNLVFTSGHDGVVVCIDVTAKGATLEELEFADNTTAEHYLTCIKATGTTNNEADGLTIRNCKYYTLDTGALEFIELNADIEPLTVTGNIYLADVGTASPLILQAAGKDMRGAFIAFNAVTNAMVDGGNLFLNNDTTTANSGVIAHNICKNLDTVTAQLLLPVGGVGMGLFGNLLTSTVGVQGATAPALDS